MVSNTLTLAGAQLAMAREFGQPSWAALVREIEARNASIPETVVVLAGRAAVSKHTNVESGSLRRFDKPPGPG